MRLSVHSLWPDEADDAGVLNRSYDFVGPGVEAAGLAVVACDAGGLPEAVVHGETGLLVAPDDPDALQQAIRALADDEPLRDRLGAAGRKRMQNEFSIATMAAKHIALYESLLAE